MYKIVLILIELLVIYGIFAFQNPFNNAKVTIIRGVMAVIIGWVMVILTSMFMSQIDMSATQAAIDLADLQEKENARKLGALFFGWAYPLIFIEMIWLSVFIFRYFKKNDSINIKTLKFKKL
jgi:heme/copper-type cytochrome/quinol oxidase subunit 2